jgi:PBP1b-binding outer membrane lipoprotein LpoB
MNGINPRLTSGELLAIFVLSLFFFLLGCSAGPQPTTAHNPAMPAAVEPEQPQSAHLHFAPPADWEVMPARPFDEPLLSSL